MATTDPIEACSSVAAATVAPLAQIVVPPEQQRLQDLQQAIAHYPSAAAQDSGLYQLTIQGGQQDIAAWSTIGASVCSSGIRLPAEAAACVSLAVQLETPLAKVAVTGGYTPETLPGDAALNDVLLFGAALTNATGAVRVASGALSAVARCGT